MKHTARHHSLRDVNSDKRYLSLFGKLACLIIVVFWFAPTAKAQTPTNIQHTENKADLALKSEARVNPSTLGMNLSIPIITYPGRANMGLPIALNYSSKVWRLDFSGIDFAPPITGRKTWTKAKFAERSVAGWTSTLGPVEVEFTGLEQFYDSVGRGACDVCIDGDPAGNFYVRRIHIYLPDGSAHELRADDKANAVGDFSAVMQSFLGTFYAVDGSRMRYESGSPGILHMPDGSRYIFPAFNNGQKLMATRYIDRHGNVNEYNHAAREWVDSLGRGIGNPLPAQPAAGEVTHYSPKLVGGSDSPPYILRWKSLSEVLTVADPNNPPPLHYAGDVKCGHNFYPQPDFSPFLFRSNFSTKVCVERDSVNGTDTAIPFNPVVLAEVELPTGNKYSFTYNVYGEIDRVILPTGGIESYDYGEIPTVSYSAAPYNQTNRGVKRRIMKESASASELSEWIYEVTTSPYTIKTTPPDKKTYTERLIHKGLNSTAVDDFVSFGFDNPLAGMIYEERVKTISGVLLRRNLTKWINAAPTAQSTDKSSGPVTTKEVSILFDGEGSNALAATTITRYEQPSQAQNPTSVTVYDYDTSKTKTQAATDGVDSFSPPDSLAIRTTATSYLDNQDYFNHGLVSLPTSMTVRAGMPTGTVVAFTATLYDESRFPLLECQATVGRAPEWIPSEDSFRGNATTSIRRLFKPDGQQDLATHNQYDACGNQRKSWDVGDTDFNNPAVTEYNDSFSDGVNWHTFAFPTRTLTPDPDGDGPLTALETKTTYDFRTGKVVSTTDANNKTIAYVYSDENDVPDPLNRLRLIIQPDGGWTRYDYGNSVGNLFLRTRAALDASHNTDSYQYFDGLGRVRRNFNYDGSAPEREWTVSDTDYDVMFKVRKVSNPYFVQTLGGSISGGLIKWTTTEYEALGRVESVTTADGAQTSSVYAANKTTATDQAGRKRSSAADALGRLTSVIEAPGNLNYETSYIYDAQGNLIEVRQGSQRRYFAYDSLSRRILARIPEQAATLTDPRAGGTWSISFEFDEDGNLKKKTDARGVETGYIYDELNRIIQRTYSDGITPWVSFSYDAPEAENSKGRLTQISSGVSIYNYTAYDAKGRILSGEQITDGQTYEMSYAYDFAGNIRTQTYPSGRMVTNSYDTAGRLSLVKNDTGSSGQNYASNFTYAAHGAVSSVKLGNGLFEHTRFSAERLLPEEIGLGTSTTDSSKLRLDYIYGEVVNGELDPTKNNGNVRFQRIAASGLDLTQNYTYDALNRLQAAQETSAADVVWKQVYKYDHFGNRNFDAGTTLPLTDVTNNPLIDSNTNRVTEDQNSDGVKEYEYDAAGNLTRDALGRTFVYNADNMQIGFNGGANSQGANYSYDGNGRRVKKITAGGTTIFVYNAAGVQVAEYTTETPPESGTKYLTTDMLGSPRIVTDQNGAVVSRHDYQPFGEEITVGRTGEYQTDDVNQQFTGQERDDESNLDYFDARYYSYMLGRFTSTDPLAESARSTNPQSWNRYAYVLNNPLKYIDPTGMLGCEASKSSCEGEQENSDEITISEDDIRKMIGTFMTCPAECLEGGPQMPLSAEVNDLLIKEITRMVNNILRGMVQAYNLEISPTSGLESSSSQGVKAEISKDGPSVGVEGSHSQSRIMDSPDSIVRNVRNLNDKIQFSLGQDLSKMVSPTVNNALGARLGNEPHVRFSNIAVGLADLARTQANEAANKIYEKHFERAKPAAFTRTWGEVIFNTKRF